MPDDSVQSSPLVNMFAEAQFESAAGAGTKTDGHPEDGTGIIHQIKVWFLAFTRIHQIPVFRKVWMWVFLMGVYSFVVDYVLGQHFPSRAFKEAAGAISFSSIILGLLLVFRTNAAYDRWWEGRKLWGQLVNDSRNMAMKVDTLVNINDDEKIRFGNLIISFAFALKHHLRDTIPSAPLPGFERVPNMAAVSMPIYVTKKMYQKMAKWIENDEIDDFTRLQLDPHIKALLDICGACERIKKTPLAISYRAYIRQGITLNLMAVPWYIPPEIPMLYALPLILIGTYFLIGLELIAEGVEEPFGKDGDDLPLDSICDTIKKSVGEILDVKAKTQFTRSYKVVQADPLNLNQTP